MKNCRFGLVWSVLLCLTACSKIVPHQETKATSEPLKLTSVAQVKAWAEDVRARDQKAFIATSQSSNLKLLNIDVTKPANAVFTTEESVDKSKMPISSESGVPDSVAAYTDGLPAGVSMSNVVKVTELSQANLSQLNYAGLLSENADKIGMIKIDERLYRVHLGDRIGRGRWRVLRFDEHKMDLQVAKKVVTYERK